MMHFMITGRIKPYVRTTQKKKWVDPQWKQYEASRTSIRWQLTQQMNANGWEILPKKTPVWVGLLYVTRSIWNHDIDNVLKAILDACQTVIFPDDRYVQSIKNLDCKMTTRPHSWATFTCGTIDGSDFLSRKETKDPDFDGYPDIVSSTYYNNP